MNNDAKLSPVYARLFIQKSGNAIHFYGSVGFCRLLTQRQQGEKDNL